ncbi:hypothetical protein QTI17_10080 [Variovorax sp. J31P179]|jgi:hypothetical protein|uniref:hypothetical protein n=1 Tax=Variovorax sp. J31P179 TaxID=3053508 RepID=UPI0025774AAB|nr:hypothetical protein [Variovorax sp. J31P179]MDM0080938.1 hypothetical protein [Variovorax sp. J31P179]
MYKPSDFLSDRRERRGARLAALSLVAVVAVTGVVLQWPRGATAAVAAIIGGDDRVAPPMGPTPPAAGGKAPATYQLRCWQNGRLLFEEGPVTLSAEARQGARMVATDRRGGALFVTADLGGTTCMARPYPPPPALWLPR